MPTFRMNTTEFFRKSAEGSFDYLGFAAKLGKHLQRAKKKYGLLREPADVRKGVVLEKPLFGLPLVAGDGICVRGAKATAGSLLLKDYSPDYDAEIIAKMRRANAAVAGKANQDALGLCRLGAGCELAEMKNPADSSRAAGCCGAAGIATAVEMPLIAIAHATCGGVCSAAWCRAFAFLPAEKPLAHPPDAHSTFRHGLIEGAWSLERLAVFAKSPEDAEIVWNALGGTVGKAEIKSAKGMRIALLNSNEEIAEYISRLESGGAAVKRLKIDFADFGINEAWFDILSAEASFNAKHYAQMKLGRQARLHLKPNMSRYKRALEIKEELKKKAQRLLRDYDIIAAPAMAKPAPKIAEAKKLSFKEIAEMHTALPLVMAQMPMAVVPVGNCGITLAGIDNTILLEAAKIMEKYTLNENKEQDNRYL